MIRQNSVEIGLLFEKLFCPKAEEDEFAECLGSLDSKSEVLKLQGEKLQGLKLSYCKSQVLCTKLKNWFEVWAKFVEFEDRSMDPSRFRQRCYNALDEEKSRKLFQQQLLKLENEIRYLVDEYELENEGLKFFVHGSHWETYIQDLKNGYKRSKTKTKNLKPKSTTPRRHVKTTVKNRLQSDQSRLPRSLVDKKTKKTCKSDTKQNNLLARPIINAAAVMNKKILTKNESDFYKKTTIKKYKIPTVPTANEAV